MRSLAIRQPFAWLVCTGHKRVENRTFSTPYRGRVAIVASGAPADGRRALKDFPDGGLPADLFAYGAYIGAVTLTDVVPLSEAVENDPHAHGPMCWLFDDPKLFHKPIPTKGKLNLYHPTADELETLAAVDTEPGITFGEPVYEEFGRWLTSDPFEQAVGHAEHYWDAQSVPDLERTAKRLLSLDTKQPEGYFTRAVAAYFAGRHREALVDCNRAIEIDPEWGQAYLGRSDVNKALGDQVAADADFARAIELDPSLADPSADDEDESEQA